MVVNILSTLDEEKAIYLAEHDGEQIIVTPDGAALDSDGELRLEDVEGWVVLNDNFEEVGLINAK